MKWMNNEMYIASNRDMYNDDNEKSKYGSKAIGVPGELKGLELAWRRYGSGVISWSRLFRDSITAAREGLSINQLLADSIQKMRPLLAKKGNLLPFLAPRGQLLNKGDILMLPALAATLQMIADKGTEAFYDGELTKNMVDDITHAGGIITLQDFKNYQAKISQPLKGSYRGYNISTAGPPFTGGPVILQTLNILEGYERLPMLWKKNEPNATHLTAEALKFGFANRMGLYDPAYSPGNETDINYIIDKMLSKQHTSTLRNRIHDNMAFNSSYYVDLIDEQLPTNVSTSFKYRNII